MELNSKESNINNQIKEAIVRTVAYFDMFDCSLTDFEIWKYINVKCDLSDVQSCLKERKIENVEDKKGFYFLRDRGQIINTRLKRYVYADRKFKRAMRMVKIFKFIPWIKMIGFSNIIGANNLRDASDIDIFIVAETKKIWLTRFFCTTIAQVLGLRPKRGDERDKICLNFYVSEDAMDLSGLMLKSKDGVSRDSIASLQDDSVGDIYFKYWLVNLIPIFERDMAYKKFVQENEWIKKYFPNWQPVQMERRRNIKSNNSRLNVLNLFNRLEGQFKKIQLKLMPDEMKNFMDKDTKVVINDKILKMHINDRREEYRNKFYNKINHLSS